MRVTLIFDCICCIRGWPACHTRFDSSICQLRCISPCPHYLTETYLIGSMKVLMGLKRNSKHDLVNGNSRGQGLGRKTQVFFFFSIPLFLVSLLPSPLLPLLSSITLLLPPVVSLELLKYAQYLEGYSIEGVRHVYKKACTIHLPKKPAVHLLWAAFEEQQGKGLSFFFLVMCSKSTSEIGL